MREKAILNYLLCVTLMLLWAGESPGQTVPSEDATVTSGVIMPPEIDAGRWQLVIGQLKANGFSEEVALECLATLQTAGKQGLPTDPVLTLVEEGARKGVAAKVLQEAVRQRLDNLQRAAEVMRQAGYGSRNTQHDQLTKSVTLALESGISADSLRGVLTEGGGKQSERMRSVVEAGETMRLSGMAEPVVGQMMKDFLERNMRRTEVIRASRFAVQQHRASVEGVRIRQQLWDGAGEGSRGGRGDNTPGAGGGQGAGAPINRGGGSMGSSASSAQGGSSVLPNAPAAQNGGGSGSGGGGTGGSDDSGGKGTGSTDAGPQVSSPDRGR